MKTPSPFWQRTILILLAAGLAAGAFAMGADAEPAKFLLTLAAGLGLGAGGIKRPGDQRKE